MVLFVCLFVCLFQSLYAQSPSNVKSLLKIVLTSKGKLHGRDVAPRWVETRSPSLCCVVLCCVVLCCVVLFCFILRFVMLCTARLGSARLGSGRLGSARLCSALLCFAFLLFGRYGSFSSHYFIVCLFVCLFVIVLHRTPLQKRQLEGAVHRVPNGFYDKGTTKTKTCSRKQNLYIIIHICY